MEVSDVILDGMLLAADQSADGQAIPLGVVEFDEQRDYPVSINFEGDPIGTARVRLEDDGLHARVTLTEPVDTSAHPLLAIGGVGTLGTFGEVSVFSIHGVAVTHGNQNPNQPPYVVVDASAGEPTRDDVLTREGGVPRP